MMKKNFAKILLLGVLFLTTLGLKLQAQTTTTINFDTASHWTAGSGSLASYQADHTYSEGIFSASTSFDALRQGTSAQDGAPGALGTYAWRLRNSGSGAWTATIASGGVSTFSVNVRRWDASPNPNYTLDYSTNGGSSWTNVATINNTTLGASSAFQSFSGTINSTNANILIRINRLGGERIMIDDFEWTDMLIPAPVQYAKINVFKNTKTTRLEWQTSTEKNCKQFNILRATDGIQFEQIGNVHTKALYGNSDGPIDYRFVDINPTSGINYYRLEQLDIDNKKFQSDVLQIVWTADGTSVSAYPNPVLDALKVDFHSNNVAIVELNVINLEGRRVKNKNIKVDKGLNKIILDMGDLDAGIYILELSSNNKIFHKTKLLKQ